ncbi:MAG: hypoxanthine phosphoribosyltransferase [Chitinophagales bacterium]|nr:hypoxanthine phosphoribosyltransferase [Chitinophagales bacterium]
MQTTLKLQDKEFVPYISEKEITEKIKLLAEQLKKDYEGKRPLFIAILNGSFMFAAALFKELEIEAEISFIKLASYKGTRSTGHVITAIGLDADVTNRHVIILEDIIDTGKTLYTFLPQLYNQHPASLKVAVLLDKPEPRKFDVPVDYVCFTIPNKFVLGFGLDFDGFGRNTKEIFQLKEE